MTDRELLEAAAKASGVGPLTWTPGATPWLLDCGRGVTWNPLTDDGDALRLAVKLGMRVSAGQVDWCAGEFVGCFEDAERDPYAATRRAIVRAAAAMVNP